MKIIPQPKAVSYAEDKAISPLKFTLNQCSLDIIVQNDFLQFSERFCKNGAGECRIHFVTDDRLEDEEYTINADDEITVKSNGYNGELYALQTLKQIIFQYGGKIPKLTVSDSPSKKIRGFMLDVGRYFYPVEDVKTIIRRMALHKLNLFHFHLTEDQGWRIEIEKYPLLTSKGSVRKKTNFNRKEHGGFYTKSEIKDIVDYAHKFGISIMPEFDIPGHSRAAIACYKELSCFERELPVADHWGVKHDVLCAGKESTYRFVEDVIDEFCELFPDKYFHIGGDEVPKHRWSLCPHCQQKIRELGLKDEEALQCYFMNRVKNYLKSKGKQVFMWSWALEDASLLDNDLGFTKCGELNTGDRPFIDTSTKAYYIDLPYGYISLDDTAGHKLFDGNCLGAEVTLWSEYVPNMKKADFMTYPRLAGMAETVWHGKCSKESIAEKLDFYYSFLDANGIGYSKRTVANPNTLRGKLQVLLFERRQLAWEGLTNIIDDKRVERLAKNR